MSAGEERQLGVVEAFVAIRDQCPSGRVQTLAEQALEAIRSREPGVLREQAYLLLAATQGWRGDRAVQVRRSLEAFLTAGSAADDGANGGPAPKPS
ncbi:MAG: hypothetical protein MJE66_12925 [Proteobacteria bacterium]|nr:hypothetical protein [Pseudomonadota bacterium]